MNDMQYQAVYNVLSFSLASMMATTMYLWFRATAVKDEYKSAVIISGLVTFIAAYHYIRIFNSWVDAYGYDGELVVTGDLTPRWGCWFASMAFFLYIVYELLVGLAAATASEADPTIAGKIKVAQVMTVISWCTYPIVYLFPMLGINAAQAVVFIQLGYCASDIISKCGVGLVIYQISYAKSSKDGLLA